MVVSSRLAQGHEVWVQRRWHVMTRTLTAVIHQEGPWYVADCPEAGTVSQGRTIEEAVANLKEATELYLEEFPLQTTAKSLLTTFEVALTTETYA
jgi:predicted RNase H-like HicB family nuclease